MEIIKYPDGSSYVKLDHFETRVTFRINSYEDLWNLNQYVDACNSNSVVPYITIPWLIDGQADRRFGMYESSGLKLVCKFLNGMNAWFTIFHPHNPEVVEAMIDNVTIIPNDNFIKIVLEQIVEPWEKAEDNLILMSSDAGGFKPLMKLCQNIDWKGETYSAAKSRNYVSGKSELVQIVDREDFGGKDVLIVDDISVYGGTFKGLAKLLRERNVGKLFLAVSHMTVQDLGTDPVTNYFDAVFTTNSKYDKYYTKKGKLPFQEELQPKNLQVIKYFKNV